jgi:hypothetical protein
MNNDKGKMNPREIKIQGLLDGYLQINLSNNNHEKPHHLDEDTLTAFVEGNLTEREAEPVTTHLVGCSFCRHITAELIKLDLAFAGEALPKLAEKSEPTKVSEVLSGVLSSIFGTTDGAVFAHQESEEEEEEEKDKVKKNTEEE